MAPIPPWGHDLPLLALVSQTPPTPIPIRGWQASTTPIQILGGAGVTSAPLSSMEIHPSWGPLPQLQVWESWGIPRGNWGNS